MVEDKEILEIISKAIVNEELLDMHPEELDKLAMFKYADDPDVTFVDTDTPDPEAGIDGHGVNTEEEMMFTWNSEEQDA